jgi:hypothetical protein
MRLTGDAGPRLLAAMENAFSPADLDRLLFERWGKQLHHFTGTGNAPLGTQILAIVSHFNMRHTVEELLIAVRDARPRDPELVALAELGGFTQYGKGLEVYLVPGQPPSPDTVDFRVRLAQRENAVCRVQTGKGTGTGFLIGADMVLTNHHVVPVAATGALTEDVVCLFDHKIGANGYTTPTLKVKATQVPAFSAPAAEDYVPGGVAVDPDRLDYVLLQLATKVGNQAIVTGFEPRRFVPIEDESLLPAVNTGIIMLQHPLGQVMKVDVGAVTWQNGTRLRHSAPTAKGSSGAPLFDVQLRLVGVHHAGQEWPELAHPYNQAIPISLIAADLRKKMIQI